MGYGDTRGIFGRFTHLHTDVGRGEGALIVIAVQGSRWVGMDSSRDVMVSW